MMNVGIDALSVYTSRYALSLHALAEARGVNPDKYQNGLGQICMSVLPPGEDIVTMGANAALPIIRDTNPNDIDMVLFATESGIDQSKAAGLFIHELLGLPARCRVVELKQACYSATAALQLAMPYLRQHPSKKVLLIASDVARYGLNTTGESSQGCGAIAMLLAANPRILAFEPESGIMAESVMDFWRPNYLDEALVEGKYSSKLYLTLLEKTWQQYHALSRRKFSDHAYVCYHTPVPRLVEKAHQSLVKLNADYHHVSQYPNDPALSLHYSRIMGNSYTAALYVGLTSLLDQAKEELSGQRIGFYSYGSGCVAEFFSGVVQPGYRDALKAKQHQHMLASRTMLSYPEYEELYQFHYPTDGRDYDVPIYETGAFRLTRLSQHKRQYEPTNLVNLKQHQVDNHESFGARQADIIG